MKFVGDAALGIQEEMRQQPPKLDKRKCERKKNRKKKMTCKNIRVVWPSRRRFRHGIIVNVIPPAVRVDLARLSIFEPAAAPPSTLPRRHPWNAAGSIEKCSHPMPPRYEKSSSIFVSRPGSRRSFANIWRKKIKSLEVSTLRSLGYSRNMFEPPAKRQKKNYIKHEHRLNLPQPSLNQ